REFVMKFLDRFMLWQKLALLIAAMAVPTALLAIFYLRETNGIVRTARSEIDGARYQQALGTALADITAHRSKSYALLSGDATRKDQVYSAESDVDRELTALDGLDYELGTRLKSTQGWQAIKSSWAAVKVGLGKAPSPDDYLKQHDALIVQMQTLISSVSMNSGLSLDSDHATAALIAAATRTVGDAVIAMSRLTEHAVGSAVKGYLGGDDRMAMQIYSTDVQSDLDALASQLQWASDDAKAKVLPDLETVNREFGAFRDTLN